MACREYNKVLNTYVIVTDGSVHKNWAAIIFLPRAYFTKLRMSSHKFRRNRPVDQTKSVIRQKNIHNPEIRMNHMLPWNVNLALYKPCSVLN